MTEDKRSYDAGTTDKGWRVDYTLLGRKSGHGYMAWVPVERALLGDPPKSDPTRTRAVVALLDGDVLAHPWLLKNGGEHFILPAAGWDKLQQDDHDVGSHRGHATFLAGIIRRLAPQSQVLPVPVMDDRGKVDEEKVVSALDWLVSYDGTLDVVLMAFGRRVVDGDDSTRLARDTKKAIEALIGTGVRVVISAGNGRTCDPVFPACYAREAGNGNGMVVSVGGGVTATFPEEYSSRGDWVTDWRPGRRVVSVMPMTPILPPKRNSTATPGSIETASVTATPGSVVTGDSTWTESGEDDGAGFAMWSGTSFAAAIVAAEFAARLEHVV
jgi:subtilisin family serine protease